MWFRKNTEPLVFILERGVHVVEHAHYEEGVWMKEMRVEEKVGIWVRRSKRKFALEKVLRQEVFLKFFGL